MKIITILLSLFVCTQVSASDTLICKCKKASSSEESDFEYEKEPQKQNALDKKIIEREAERSVERVRLDSRR